MIYKYIFLFNMSSVASIRRICSRNWAHKFSPTFRVKFSPTFWLKPSPLGSCLKGVDCPVKKGDFLNVSDAQQKWVKFAKNVDCLVKMRRGV